MAINLQQHAEELEPIHASVVLGSLGREQFRDAKHLPCDFAV
jgi:hypothetical protein